MREVGRCNRNRADVCSEERLEGFAGLSARESFSEFRRAFVRDVINRNQPDARIFARYAGVQSSENARSNQPVPDDAPFFHERPPYKDGPVGHVIAALNGR
jgi:hypothetical protein